MIFDEFQKACLEQHLTFFFLNDFFCESSEELFENAMNSQNANVQYIIGCFFEKSSMNDEFLALWHKAAESNHAKAKYRLGFVYYYGQCGIAENQEKGIQLWKESGLKKSC